MVQTGTLRFPYLSSTLLYHQFYIRVDPRFLQGCLIQHEMFFIEECVQVLFLIVRVNNKWLRIKDSTLLSAFINPYRRMIRIGGDLHCEDIIWMLKSLARAFSMVIHPSSLQIRWVVLSYLSCWHLLILYFLHKLVS